MFHYSPRLRFLAVVATCLVVGAAPRRAHAQAMPGGQPSGMPDARMMSGIPMPMSDVPDGTISVRVVRGEISNVIAGQSVDLVVDGKTRSQKTDESGRAQFAGVAPGSNAVAVAVVGSERIQSQPFTMPEKGGVRLLLAASAAGGASAQPQAPPVAGDVTFGGDSRIVIEFDDDSLNVFYLLDVVNSGTAPVNPLKPVAFELPPDATSATVLEGSSPQAEAKGRHVSIAGPFKPGRTTVQIAYQLPPGGADRAFAQAFPVPFDAVSIAVQKVGSVEVKSVQLTQQQTVPADNKLYVFATGPTLAAGRPLSIELSGLPHHDRRPQIAALVIALVILGGGAWSALGRPQDGAEARRRELTARRDSLFAELLRLEQRKRAGSIEADAYRGRRADIMAALERIYGELDSAAAGPATEPPGGGNRGLAA